MNKFLYLLLIALLGVFTLVPARAEPPPEERARIQKLIDHVRGLQGAAFIRNGKEHDAATAAEFLRRKWRANDRSVHTAEDFIELIATGSSTTGTPYTIRLGDGKTVKCAEFLTLQLQQQG
jgi:hypothetical protein